MKNIMMTQMPLRFTSFCSSIALQLFKVQKKIRAPRAVYILEMINKKKSCPPDRQRGLKQRKGHIAPAGREVIYESPINLFAACPSAKIKIKAGYCCCYEKKKYTNFL